MRHAVVFLVSILVPLLLCCSSNSVAGSPTITHPRLAIRLHKGVGMVAGYDYSTVEPKVSALPAEGAVAIVDERDIDEYRVPPKTGGPATVSGIDIVLSEAATQRIAPAGDLQEVFQEGPFAVRFDDKLLYGGQCYPPMGAAALRYPVIHVSSERRRMVLAVKPQQAPWIDPNDTALNTRIDPPALRDYFRALGKLVER